MPSLVSFALPIVFAFSHSNILDLDIDWETIFTGSEVGHLGFNFHVASRSSYSNSNFANFTNVDSIAVQIIPYSSLPRFLLTSFIIYILFTPFETCISNLLFIYFINF